MGRRLARGQLSLCSRIVYTAVMLYQAGRVKLLMTGDNRTVDYNESAHMRAYALELGVPDEDIVLDYAGRRTYDSIIAPGISLGGCGDTRHPGLPPDRAPFTAHGLGLDGRALVTA